MPKPEIIRCPACGRKKTRSNPANARYWLLLHLISEKVRPKGEDEKPVTYSADTWHQYFKSRFLGMDEFVLPNKKTVQFPKSTTGLDVAEFNEYMEKVEHWAGEHDVWLEAME